MIIFDDCPFLCHSNTHKKSNNGSALCCVYGSHRLYCPLPKWILTLIVNNYVKIITFVIISQKIISKIIKFFRNKIFREIQKLYSILNVVGTLNCISCFNRITVTQSNPSHGINTTFGVGEDTEPSEVYI